MRIKSLTLLVIICLITPCCYNRQAKINTGNNDSILNPVNVQQLVPNPKINENSSLEETIQIDTVLEGKDKEFFTNYKFKEIARRSNYNLHMLGLKDRTLYICCINDHFLYIFGTLKKEELLNQYHFLRYKAEKNLLGDSLIVINVYYFLNSFFKTYYNSYLSSQTIAYARIIDKEFVLQHNIHVGMDEKIFLQLLFNKDDVDFLSKADTINLSDIETGEMTYKYIFVNKKLNEILIETYSDWVDKNL